MASIQPLGQLLRSLYLLLPTRRDEKHIRLGFSTREINTVQIVSLILLFAWRAALDAVKGIRLFGNARAKATESELELPDLQLSMPLDVDAAILDAYATALQLTISEPVQVNDAQLCLLLSAVSEPALLLLLAKKDCPVRPLGSVNVRNRFELFKPDLCQPSKLGALHDKTVISRLLPATRRVKRGVEIDIEVLIEGCPEGSTDKETLFMQTWTMLQIEKPKVGKPSNDNKPSTVAVDITLDNPSSTRLEIPLWAPSRWAAVCKDYNPIHMSAIAGRMYGFPGKLAHGNHVLALAIQKLNVESAEAGQFTSLAKEPIWIEVKFMRPVVLPTDLVVKYSQASDEHKKSVVSVEQKGKACVHAEMGRIGTAKP